MRFRVLIVDDEREMRQMLKRLLELEGFIVQEADNAEESIRILNENEFDCILSDVKLPDGSGVELVKKFKKLHARTEVVLITAFGNVHDGVEALKRGAFDYLLKGEDNDRIAKIVSNACEKSSLSKRVADLQSRLTEDITFEDILGNSQAIKECIELARKVGATDTTVLITGATGTGKEIFSRAIHNCSPRKDHSFLAVNCGSFSKELLESELFGYKSGAFTGAVKDKKGIIDEVSGGTLMLDEIGEMPSEVQTKLLRVLETGEYFRIGETVPRFADFRLIAATNRDLEKDSESGKFRSDLYYRLSAFKINLPDLNTRREDIRCLAEFFTDKLSAKVGRNFSGMTDEFVEALQNHNWRGNIRELRNIIERACIIEESNQLTVESLPIELRSNTDSSSHKDSTLAEAERIHIITMLSKTNGNKKRTAELLGIGLSTLYSKLKEYGIE